MNGDQGVDESKPLAVNYSSDDRKGDISTTSSISLDHIESGHKMSSEQISHTFGDKITKNVKETKDSSAARVDGGLLDQSSDEFTLRSHLKYGLGQLDSLHELYSNNPSVAIGGLNSVFCGWNSPFGCNTSNWWWWLLYYLYTLPAGTIPTRVWYIVMMWLLQSLIFGNPGQNYRLQRTPKAIATADMLRKTWYFICLTGFICWLIVLGVAYYYGNFFDPNDLRNLVDLI